jgi:hypothetical protein
MLEDLKPPVRQFPCKVRTVLSELDDKDKKILIDALADTAAWPHKTLSNALKTRGVQLVDSSIQRHREGNCSC